MHQGQLKAVSLLDFDLLEQLRFEPVTFQWLDDNQSASFAKSLSYKLYLYKNVLIHKHL